MRTLVQRTSVRATLIEMSVGETLGLAFDAIAYSTVRHYATALGVELERTYSVHLNRDNRTYEVTRHE